MIDTAGWRFRRSRPFAVHAGAAPGPAWRGRADRPPRPDAAPDETEKAQQGTAKKRSRNSKFLKNKQVANSE